MHAYEKIDLPLVHRFVNLIQRCTLQAQQIAPRVVEIARREGLIIDLPSVSRVCEMVRSDIRQVQSYFSILNRIAPITLRAFDGDIHCMHPEVLISRILSCAFVCSDTLFLRRNILP